jgi:hypothetical protein
MRKVRVVSGTTGRSTCRRLVSILFVGALFVLCGSPAWSAGIGGNFTFGSSDGRVDDEDDFFPDINTSADVFEIGLSFDTNLAKDRLVNYRLNANLQIIKQKLNQRAAKAKIDGTGFALNQLVGFGVYRTPRMRVFVGPSVHLGIAGFDEHETVQGVRVKYEEVLFTAALGPEVGVNLHVGKRLSVSLTGFYRYGLQVQGYDDPYDVGSDSDGVFTGDEHRVGVTTAIYFRTGGDQYKKRVRKKRRAKSAPKPAEPAPEATEPAPKSTE